MNKRNENRPGYKLTKVGWIPDEWLAVQLQELGTWQGGGTPAKNILSYWENGVVPFASSQDIKSRVLRNTAYMITLDALRNSATNLVPPNSLVMVTRSGILRHTFPVAKTLTSVAINQDIKALVPKKEIDCDFLLNVMHANGQDILRTCAKVGTTVESVEYEWLKRYTIPLPPLPEQQKIAEILGAWDRAVEQTVRLMKAKKQLKQGLMQQLLTGRMRFPEFKSLAWKRIELARFLIFTPRPVARPERPYQALGLRSHGKGTFFRTVEDPSKVMMDTLYQVQKNDLIVNITFAWEGAIALVDEPCERALVSHRFPTFIFDRSICLPEYLKHLILTKRFVHELGLASPGGAGRNRVLSKTGLLKIEVPVPPVEEQKKVAGILEVLEVELCALNQLKIRLVDQKKALMQNLLTGEVRVKV